METIYIVEDDATIIQVVSEKLNSWGYDCKGVTDFQNVLSECLELGPQLILSRDQETFAGADHFYLISC